MDLGIISGDNFNWTPRFLTLKNFTADAEETKGIESMLLFTEHRGK